MNQFDALPKPFFVLAPMDDVTDTVFRRIVAGCAPPDLYFTEFVNVEGLQSPGRVNLLRKLRFTPAEQPLIAQIWGKDPDNFYKTARDLADGSLAEELAWYARRSGSDKVQGSKEKRASRTISTVSERQTQMTQQFAESDGSAGGSAGSGTGATWTSGNFAGIDLNMGCPDKTVVKNGTCSALINNRELALEIIQATQEGAGGKLPVSVKIRLGFSTIDLSWPEFLLQQNLAMLTVHLRTRKEMSLAPAHWDTIAQICEMRDTLAPETKIVGNGDVLTRAQGAELAEQYGLDGIMIGRGVFHDPYVFAEASPWPAASREERIALYAKHVTLFAETWQGGERNVALLNKFCKIYINAFDGAKELRERLMAARSTEELLVLLRTANV